MKLLLLTPQSPYPPRQGTTLRNYFLLRHLARRHEVHLFSCLGPQDETWPDPRLLQLCRRLEGFRQPGRPAAQRLKQTFFAAQPDMALRLDREEGHALLGRMLREE